MLISPLVLCGAVRHAVAWSRDLGHAVKQLKTALETNRTTIREKNSRIKALEERLASLSASASSDGQRGEVQRGGDQRGGDPRGGDLRGDQRERQRGEQREHQRGDVRERQRSDQRGNSMGMPSISS